MMHEGMSHKVFLQSRHWICFFSIVLPDLLMLHDRFGQMFRAKSSLQHTSHVRFARVDFDVCLHGLNVLIRAVCFIALCFIALCFLGCMLLQGIKITCNAGSIWRCMDGVQRSVRICCSIS